MAADATGTGHWPARRASTVLDLSSVGPAARCTRLLADYGATVVKVGPVPGRGPAPVDAALLRLQRPAGHAPRAAIDLQRPRRAATPSCALAAGADVVVESFRPGVVDRLGIGYEDRARRQRRRSSTARRAATARTGPRAGWAGHDLNYLAVGGYLAATGPRADGGPAGPGRHHRRCRRRRHARRPGHRAPRWSAAAAHRRGHLPRRVRGRRGAVAHVPGRRRAPGHRAPSPGPGHDVLTGRYACYDTYRAADGRWLAVAAIEAKFFANLCRALGCEQWIEHQYDDDVQDADPRRLRGRLRPARPRRLGGRARRAPTPAWRRSRPCRRSPHDPQFARRRGAVVEAKHPTPTGDLPPGGCRCWPAWLRCRRR